MPTLSEAFSRVRHLGQPNAAVEYNPMDLINFIIKNFGPLNAMMERPTTSTQYRDASGRLTGSATTHRNNSHTTYRDASGRIIGTATTSNSAGTTSHTQFRDATGRLTGSESTSGIGATTRRDSSGRLTGTSSANGQCSGGTRTPLP